MFQTAGGLLFGVALAGAALFVVFMWVWGLEGCEYDASDDLGYTQRLVVQGFLLTGAVGLLWAGLGRLLHRAALVWLCLGGAAVAIGIIVALLLPLYFPECVNPPGSG